MLGGGGAEAVPNQPCEENPHAGKHLFVNNLRGLCFMRGPFFYSKCVTKLEVCMFWTKKERKEFWERNQIAFAERSNEFYCCYIPTIADCKKCVVDPVDCENKAEIVEVLFPRVVRWAPWKRRW